MFFPEKYVVDIIKIVKQSIQMRETLVILADQTIPYAAAQASKNVISYNPQQFRQLCRVDPTGSTVVGILGHEIFHILFKQSRNSKKTHTLELLADAGAGWILCRLGMDTKNFENFIRINSYSNTPTHPDNMRRIDAIRKGFQECIKYYR